MDESRGDGMLWIDAYENRQIHVDGVAYGEPICLNGSAVMPIARTAPTDLEADDFQAAMNAHPEVILVGTGSQQVFLPPKLIAQLGSHGIGMEVMSTAAACRTYMILRSEGRSVWAWLWP
ncbi:Mth938-like domain-containing protein [Snodgrassella sp. CFCC 13594]|uniref:Mth938-like domain-containing protein n=1 Tax=Snodgrassella sp. CFCC 13594 TaxID=1775559 RepID=UPI00082B3750|nr:Mth938-like domain-containing protein [Snodgrassella sp. CFCC 13594]